MKRALLLATLSLAACQNGGTFLRVTVNDIPAGATKLRVSSIVGGRVSDPIDISLAGKSGTRQSFALELPSLPGVWGQLGLVAIDDADPPCVLGWQTSQGDTRIYTAGSTTELTYDLIAAPTEGCTAPRTPGMVLIPAGDYLLGCTASSVCEADQAPQKKTQLDAFEIDVIEVTAGEYFDCVNEGKCDPAIDGPTYPSNVARNFVTWPLAKAFCAARGKILPTEAQWEAAARGPNGNTYPWGEDEPTCDLANFFGGEDNTPCRSFIGSDVLRTFFVGGSPSGASPFGLLDMAGNVEEWVEDAYTSRANLGDYAIPHEAGAMRVMKGGSNLSFAWDLRGAARRAQDPVPTSDDPDVPASTYTVNVGFRCARAAGTP